jgi:hypothetical protein
MTYYCRTCQCKITINDGNICPNCLNEMDRLSGDVMLELRRESAQFKTYLIMTFLFSMPNLIPGKVLNEIPCYQIPSVYHKVNKLYKYINN